jgi:sialidase-1
MRCLLLLTAVLVAVAAAAESHPPEPETVEVFPAGMPSAGSRGIARYRIPGVVVSPRGTVLAYCEARKNDAKDWGEIEIHLRRSTDGGRTWLPSQHIAHHGPRIEGNPRKPVGGEHEQTVNNPVAIVDHETGAIVLLYCVNYARCFTMQSTDDGLTWSEPVEITAAFEPFRRWYDWTVIATGPGHGLQVRGSPAGGRLVVPIWLAYGKDGDHAPSAAATIYSDDHGATWRAGDLAVPNEPPFTNPNETMIATTADGGVVLVTRSVSAANRKIVTRSPDGATGWSPPEFHDALWEPICMAGLLAHPSRPGTLLFSGPRTLARDEAGAEIPAGRGTRQNLSISLSHDDGRTWPVVKTLEAGPAAYSDLAVLPDGTVLCLYERGDAIDCARFDLDWVERP